MSDVLAPKATKRYLLPPGLTRRPRTRARLLGGVRLAFPGRALSGQDNAPGVQPDAPAPEPTWWATPDLGTPAFPGTELACDIVAPVDTPDPDAYIAGAFPEEPPPSGEPDPEPTEFPAPDEDLAEDPRGQVYVFLEDGGERCKIGKTNDITRRLRDVGYMNSKPLHLVALVKGYTRVEHWFHKYFASYRCRRPNGAYHGEWFRFEGALADMVDKIRAGLTSAVLCPHALADDGFRPDPAQAAEQAAELERQAQEQEAQEQRAQQIAELIELARKIGRRKMLRNLGAFVREAWTRLYPANPLEWGPHLDALCHNIQSQLEDRWRVLKDKSAVLRAQNMLINVPPRCLKSTILAIATVWAWLREPTMRIMYLSCNPRVAQGTARIARDLITHDWFKETFQPTWTIRRDQDSLSDLGNTAGGTRASRGLESKVVGEGADWICIDDPHDLKDTQDQIDTTIAEYDAAVHNRINDPRAAIRTCIMQRVEARDFSAHVLKTGWLHVRMPMEFRTQTKCKCGTCMPGVANVYGWVDWRTAEGQVLHVRFNATFLAGERVRLGAFGYAAQMQQDPVSEAGGRAKREYWRFCRLMGHNSGDRARPDGCVPESKSPTLWIPASRAGGWELDWMLLSVDAANKKTENGSNWGLTVIAGKDERRLILDDRSRRGDFLEILQICREILIQWRPSRLLIEGKAAGPSLMVTLEEELAAGKIRDASDNPITCFIEEIEPEGDKAKRLDAVSPLFQAGLVYLLEGAEWVDTYVEELALFPKYPTDDRVDTTSQALQHMRSNTSTLDVPASQWAMAMRG